MRIASAIAVLVAGLAAPAYGAECPTWQELKAFLAEKHHEAEVGGGLIDQSAVLVLLMAPGGDTWTVARLGTDGKACIVAYGADWFQRSIPALVERGS